MERIVWITAIVVTGPLVGIELGVAAVVNPLASRLPESGFRQVRAGGSRWLGLLMPFWYFGTIALLVATAVLSHAGAAVIAAAVMVAALILTVTILVPMNTSIGRWTTYTDVDRGLAARWDRYHWLRVAMLAAAFVSLTLAGARFG